MNNIKNIVLLILFIVYVFYLYIEEPLVTDEDPYRFNNYQEAQLDEHKLALSTIYQKGSTIKGLILGGSNAMSGLSARQMSDQTGEGVFYNFSLSGSKYKVDIYLDYLKEASYLINAATVEAIIFSDLTFFTRDSVDDTVNYDEKRTRVKIFPRTPMLKYLKNKIAPSKYSRDFEFGDFDWETSASQVAPDGCDPLGEPFTMIPNSLDYIFQRSLKFSQSIKEIFPNSKTYFVVPTIYSENINLYEDYFNDLKTSFSEANLNLILKPPKSDSTIFCLSGFYVNVGGRIIRTNDVIEIINKN